MISLLLPLVFNPVPPPPPVVYTPPEICEYLPDGDWEACQAPEEWNDFCISWTSYWPFDDNGNLVAFNGQTDGDPTKTATGIEVASVEQAETWVAGPLPLITNGYSSVICLYGRRCLPVWDTFGHPTYQAGGFWHEGYQKRVIGIDVFSPERYHHVSCRDSDNPSRFYIDIYKDGVLTNP